MDQSLYDFSLLIALPLMLFFGFNMLFARVPEDRKYTSFLLSRRLMGAAILVLALNYAVHFFFSIRFKDLNATILMNLVTYFLCYWLFSLAMMVLLDRNYLNARRFAIHICLWILYCAISCASFFLPGRTWSTIFLAALLMSYGLFLSVRLLRTYSDAIRMFKNTHSDDIGAYIRWMSVFTYWAIAFGVSCSALTFLPDKYVFLWVLAAVPFYIYLFCCYQNYIFFYKKVEDAFLEDISEDEYAKAPLENERGVPEYHSELSRRIAEWIAEEGYRKQGITLNELSSLLCTNRTYLSEYIKTVYGKSFRDWISDLRLEYAKALMMHNPQMKIQEVSDISGFLSLSHFSRTFSEREGCSPARWRKSAL